MRALSYLAAYLEQGGRDPTERSATGPPQSLGSPGRETERISFAWWELRVVAAPIIGLTIGLPAAVAVGLVAAVIPGLGVGLGLGMIVGIAVGMGTGMILARSWHLPRSPDGVGVGIVCGFVGALLGAAPTGIILHATGHASSPVPGLMGRSVPGSARGSAAGSGAESRLPRRAASSAR